MSGAFQQLRNETRVEGVSGTVRNQAAEDRLSNQGKIPKQVEHLMTDKFILEPQRRVVHHALFREYDRILERTAANQAAGLKHLHFVVEPEGSSRRDGIGEAKALAYRRARQDGFSV